MNAKSKLVYGVGVNDASYAVTRYEISDGKRTQVWVCPFYIRWASMIQRCYDRLCQIKHPTYVGCRVVDEWLVFSAFKSWMENQEWVGKELDKDLLSKGNRIYGPDYCCFITRQVNCLVREMLTANGLLPVGVAFYEKRNKFRSRANCVFTRKRNHLGYFETPHQAHEAWLTFMRGQAEVLATQQTDRRAAKALVDLYGSSEAKNA